MYLIVTRSFPPEVGGMQSLMWGLTKEMSKNFMIKVFADYHENHKKLDQKELFEIKTTKQLYDESENQFLADRYVVGECPKCGHKHAYGDQCESCGASLSPNDLINPKSKLSGSKPILKETKHWYLPLG